MIKRLGIFCTYDAEGIVDDYIIYLLQEMKKVLDYIVIVGNGKILPESRDILEKYADKFLARENIGFDMEAWRQGIFLVKDKFSKYDEIVIFNDSFYGPFYSAEEIFDEMNRRNPEADFWGITIHGKGDDPENLCPYGYVPEHIQSYFLVVRSKMFHSTEFLHYWENAEVAQTFSEAVKKHEVCFTKYFYDMGFRYAVYCDTREYEKDFDIKFNPYVFFTKKLLNEMHCPIIKKRIFYFGRGAFLGETYGDSPRESLKFLRENTNYPVELIIKNLLRKLNIATVKTDLALDYFPSSTMITNKTINFKDAVIVAHLYYKDLMPKCVKYLCNAPKDIKIVVTVSEEEKKSLIEKLFTEAGRNAEVRIVSARGRDLSALYVGCADLFKKYKYLGFIHDKKSLRAGEAVTNGEEFFNLLWKNFLPEENFIANTLATLEDDPNLGVLVPPPPYHGKYGKVFFVDRFWSTDLVYNTTLKVARDLQINEKFFNRRIPPLTLGNVFWCKTAALKRITDKGWTLEDFTEEPMPVDGTVSHALERMLAYAAQAEGFYTGWLMTEDFAKDEIENYLFFAINHLELAAANAANVANVVNVSNGIQTTININPALDVDLMQKLFSDLTTLQCLKFYLRSRISEKFWFLFRPFKHLLEKFGLRV